MKKRILIPTTIIIIALLFVLYYFLTIPKLELNAMDPLEKYTYLTENDVLESIDEQASRYSSLEIFIQNKDEWIPFDEYNQWLRNEHPSIEFDQEGLPLFDDVHVQLRVKSRFFTDSKEMEIKVVDTIAPTLTVLYGKEDLVAESSLVFLEGVKLEDVIKTSAIDQYFNLPRNIEVTSSVDMSAPLEYGNNLTVVFETKDESDNTTSITVNIEVEKKPETIVPSTTEVTPPVQTNNDLATGDLNRVDVLVNKKNALPSDFVPNLTTFPSGYAISDGYRGTQETVNAFISLVDALKSETDLWMYVTSSYRSYQSQSELYNSYVKNNGQAEADKFSAKPGKSEHQTGLAIDLVTPGGSMWDFASTPQSDWLKVNAHKYGFILRYLEGKEHITGYMYESWHIRYLGIDLATNVYNSGLTYEEYLGGS